MWTLGVVYGVCSWLEVSTVLVLSTETYNQLLSESRSVVKLRLHHFGLQLAAVDLVLLCSLCELRIAVHGKIAHCYRFWLVWPSCSLISRPEGGLLTVQNSRIGVPPTNPLCENS